MITKPNGRLATGPYLCECGHLGEEHAVVHGLDPANVSAVVTLTACAACFRDGSERWVHDYASTGETA